MPPSPNLREAILAHMPQILQVVRPEERVWYSGDVRPAIILMIKNIAEFEPEPAAVERNRLNATIKTANRLRLVIGGRPGRASLDAELEREIERCEQELSAISERDRANWQRLCLAANLTYDLLLDNGLGIPTLSGEGKYVRVTALVVETATRRSCSSSSAQRACKRRFDELQMQNLDGLSGAELEEERRCNPWPFSQRGRRRRELPSDNDDNDDLEALIEADIEECRRRLVAEARGYPPLERLLDEILR